MKKDIKDMKSYDEFISNEYEDMTTLRLRLCNVLLYYDELNAVEVQNNEEMFHNYYDSIKEVEELTYILINMLLQKDLVDDETLTKLLQFTQQQMKQNEERLNK